jgi:hypothetical protein
MNSPSQGIHFLCQSEIQYGHHYKTLITIEIWIKKMLSETELKLNPGSSQSLVQGWSGKT